MDRGTLKHLDLFSGYGGFSIPASKYGIETINFSEIDKYATAVLKYRFPDIKNLGDITKIKGEDLPTIDIITGGSPCQDLSVAGKGAGLDGGRSGLFFCFINLIKEKQPMYFVWENVKGAFSSSKGWDFARVQIEMEQAGYDVFWQLINAKDFGVPQNRERIFAIGVRKGSGREILFERIGSSQDIKTQQQVSSTIHAGYYKQGGRDQQYVEGGAVIYRGRPNMPYEKGHRTLRYEKYDKNCPALTQNCAAGDQMNMVAIPNSNGNIHSLDANYWKGSNNPNKSRRSQVIVHNLQPRSPNRPSLLKNKNAGGSGHLQREDGITYTVDTGCTQGVEIAVPMRWSRTEEGKRARKEAMKNGKDYTPFSGGARTLTESKEDVSGCLTNALNKDALLKHDMRIRRLTPTECERLMGLEDGWTAKGIIDGKEVDISDTQRYKMCGNGVVVNCVDYIYNLITKSYEW